MKANPTYSWRIISSNHFELLCNGSRIAFMAIHEGLANRSARILLDDSELFIITSGLWSNKTLLFNDKGEWHAGYIQNKWFSNNYKYFGKNHTLSMVWNNEEAILEIRSLDTQFLSLKLIGSQSFEIEYVNCVDFDMLFLSWFFFVPMVVNQPVTAFLY